MKFSHPRSASKALARFDAKALVDRADLVRDALAGLPLSRIAVLGGLVALVLLAAYVRVVLGLVRAGEEFRIEQVAQERAAARMPVRLSVASDKRSAAPLMVAAAGKFESSHNGS